VTLDTTPPYPRPVRTKIDAAARDLPDQLAGMQSNAKYANEKPAPQQRLVIAADLVDAIATQKGHPKAAVAHAIQEFIGLGLLSAEIAVKPEWFISVESMPLGVSFPEKKEIDCALGYRMYGGFEPAGGFPSIPPAPLENSIPLPPPIDEDESILNWTEEDKRSFREWLQSKQPEWEEKRQEILRGLEHAMQPLPTPSYAELFQGPSFAEQVAEKIAESLRGQIEVTPKSEPDPPRNAVPPKSESAADSKHESPKRAGRRRLAESSDEESRLKANLYALIQKEKKEGEGEKKLADRLRKMADIVQLAKEAGIESITKDTVKAALQAARRPPTK
jgi:hypothetical protein